MLPTFRYLASLGLLAVTAPLAQAQWVMVARAVSGRVQQMSQKDKNGSGYDVATVLLDAKADKVYETALNALNAHSPEITVTSHNDKKRKVEFTNGQVVASMQVTSLGPTATQLVVASTLAPGQPSATSTVVNGIMHVCEQMKVECKLAEQ